MEDERVNVIEEKGNGLTKVAFVIFGLAITGLSIGLKKVYNKLSHQIKQNEIELDRTKNNVNKMKEIILQAEDNHIKTHDEIMNKLNDEHDFVQSIKDDFADVRKDITAYMKQNKAESSKKKPTGKGGVKPEDTSDTEQSGDE